MVAIYRVSCNMCIMGRHMRSRDRRIQLAKPPLGTPNLLGQPRAHLPLRVV